MISLYRYTSACGVNVVCSNLGDSQKQISLAHVVVVVVVVVLGIVVAVIVVVVFASGRGNTYYCHDKPSVRLLSNLLLR